MNAQRWLVCALIPLLLIACADNGTGPADPPSITGQTYDNPTLAVRLTTPGGWTMSMDTTLENEPLLLFAYDSDTGDTRLVLTLTRNLLFEGGTDDPAVAVAHVQGGLVVKYPDHQVVETDTFLVDSVTCVSLTFDATIDNKTTRTFLLYIIHEGHHILTSFSSEPATLTSKEDIVAAIIGTIELY